MSLGQILLTAAGIYLLYILIRFFIRFLLPIILGVRAIRKAQKQFYSQGGGDMKDNYNRPEAPEGEVTVEKTTTSTKIIKDDIGDDVPYEDVK